MILIYENDETGDRRYFISDWRVDNPRGTPGGRDRARDFDKCYADYTLTKRHSWEGYVVRVLKEDGK